RVVMRDEPERGAIRARLDRDDVRHVRGRSELAALRVDLLHAHVVAEETELVDDVLPGPGVLRRADGAAADGAGQHLHVSAGVFEGEVRRVTRAARTGEHQSKKGYPSRPNHPAQGSPSRGGLSACACSFSPRRHRGHGGAQRDPGYRDTWVKISAPTRRRQLKIDGRPTALYSQRPLSALCGSAK